MHDDTWWDGEDDAHIAELQRVLAPLREPARPWGEVHARVRFESQPGRRPVVRMLAVALAMAAAMALGWWWGHADASHPAIVPVPVIGDMPVAEPQPARAEPAARTVVVPMPVPIIVTDDDVATGARRELLQKQFARLDAEKQARKGGRPRLDADETVMLLEAAVRAGAPEEAARVDDLPETLTTLDIKNGIAPHRAAAKACGARHNVEPGLSVIIKLSIEGATGRVTSAVAQSPHAGTDLGRCVAKALGKAQFPRFRKASLGVVYPVSM
jgi:hypothetical protein